MTRGEALDILKYNSNVIHQTINGETDPKEVEALDMAIKSLGQEPERKTGEWIDYSEDGFVECPFCHSATNCDWNKDELHYCFSCGAELRG